MSAADAVRAGIERIQELERELSGVRDQRDDALASMEAIMTERETVGWRWRFEDEPDKWHVQKHLPHWYSSFMTDVIMEPLISGKVQP